MDGPAGTWRDKWTDGHVNESDFIGHCLTNILDPTKTSTAAVDPQHLKFKVAE